LAFTLIEMLVVIAIILIITAIGVLAIPSAQDRSMQSGADQLQGWLLIAKQRAKREGRPTGLRILFDATTQQASQCQYIYQPDDVRIPGSTCRCGTIGVEGPAGASFNVSFTGANVNLVNAGVQAGDYLEFNRGGGVYQIATVLPVALTLVNTGPKPPNLYSAAVTNQVSNPTASTSEYRIIRQPVLLPGEETLQLPDGVVIDQNQSLNIPTRGNFSEVLFSPQGGLVGRGTGSDGLCVLWIANTKNASAFPLLVAIQTHTGFVGVFQENTDPAKGNKYANCRDGRASGL
jgi:prepilin-type N-terminal cleavage/methylation domain-containing protein